MATASSCGISVVGQLVWVRGVAGSKSLVRGIALENGVHFSCLGESSL